MIPVLRPPEAGFLGLAPEERAGTSKPVVRVMPVGLERSVSYGSGTARGPAAILAASHQVELFDEELWCEPCRLFRLETLDEPVLPDELEPALASVEALVAKTLDRKAFPMILGGEHSLTAAAIRPFVARYGELGLLHFDAHADLRESYAGDRFSHACSIRRCLDAPDLTVVSVGIRNISAEEIPFLEANRHRLTLHFAKDMAAWRIEELLSPLAGRPVYITFDLDGFDSGLMPATGTPEPGGFFWADVMPILRAACRTCTIVGADIVELAPQPGLHACDFLAAKLAYKLLGYRFSNAA